MSDRATIRPLLRLVVACALVANGIAALTVQGEREIYRFRVTVGLDRDRLSLTEEAAAYGAAGERLHAEIAEEARP